MILSPDLVDMILQNKVRSLQCFGNKRFSSYIKYCEVGKAKSCENGFLPKEGDVCLLAPGKSLQKHVHSCLC